MVTAPWAPFVRAVISRASPSGSLSLAMTARGLARILLDRECRVVERDRMSLTGVMVTLTVPVATPPLPSLMV